MVRFWGSDESPFLGLQMATFLICPHMSFPGLCIRKKRERKEEVERENCAPPLLRKLLIPSEGPHPHDLINPTTSQRSHLQMPLHCRFGL